MEIDTNFKASGDSSTVAKWKRATFLAVVIIIGLAIGWGVHAGTYEDDDDDSSSSPIPTPAPAASILDAKEVERVRSMVDFSVDPCEDFYEYACGGWIKNQSWRVNPATMGEYTVMTDLRTKGVAEIQQLLSQNLPLVSTYYDACMDVDAIDALGTTAILDEINKIFAQTTLADLMSLVGSFHKEGLARKAFFKPRLLADQQKADVYRLYLEPGGLWFDSNPAAAFEQQQQFLTTIYNYLESINHPAWNNTHIQQLAQAVLTIEQQNTMLWLKFLMAIDRNDVGQLINVTTIATAHELDSLFGQSFGFSSYLLAASLTPNPTTDLVFVWALPYFQAFTTYLQTEELDNIKAYLTFHLLGEAAIYLPAATRLVEPSLSRVGLCFEETIKPFANLLSHAWILSTWSKKQQQFAVEMTSYVYHMFEEMIEEANWLDQETKQHAFLKWRFMTKNIGYDQYWLDFEGLTLSRATAFDNYRKTMAWLNTKYFANLYGKPIERNQIPATDYITPDFFSTNAFYYHQSNSINLLAGMMGQPLFSPERPMLLNFAAYGTIIGHEITHGFDNKGRLFNGTGAYVSWWTAEAEHAFNERAKCLETQYANYTVQGKPVDGKKTLGENIADNGGVNLAWKAYKRYTNETQQLVEGFTNDQLFFLAYAQSQCRIQTPSLQLYYLETDKYSPPRYRVNGPLSNMPEFARAYKCSASSAMGRSLTQARCKVW